MEIMINFITGCMVGFELVQDEEIGSCVVVDLFIVRLLFCWG